MSVYHITIDIVQESHWEPRAVPESSSAHSVFFVSVSRRFFTLRNHISTAESKKKRIQGKRQVAPVRSFPIYQKSPMAFLEAPFSILLLTFLLLWMDFIFQNSFRYTEKMSKQYRLLTYYFTYSFPLLLTFYGGLLQLMIWYWYIITS